MNADQPLLAITSGKPTPEEVAAVTAVLLGRSGPPAGQPVQQMGGWADPALRLRRPLPPGPGAWRASAWH